MPWTRWCDGVWCRTVSRRSWLSWRELHWAVAFAMAGWWLLDRRRVLDVQLCTRSLPCIICRGDAGTYSCRFIRKRVSLPAEPDSPGAKGRRVDDAYLMNEHAKSLHLRKSGSLKLAVRALI